MEMADTDISRRDFFAGIFMKTFVAFVLLFTCLEAGAQPDLGMRLEKYEYPFSVKYLRTTVQLQPVEIAYMDVSPTKPNGRTVLLFHGKNFPSAYWKGTINALTSAGYRVIAPDALGFGKSSKPVLQYSFSLLASIANELVESLGVSHTAVLGHSMGGMLASRFALTYPDKVTALILEDALGLEDWRAKGVPYRRVDEWYAEEKSTTYERIMNYHKTSYYPDWKDEYKEWIDVQYGMAKSGNPDQYAMVSALTYDMIFNQPVVYEFKDIKVPTLVIAGSKDKTKLARNAPPEVAEKLGDYRELTWQTSRTIPGAKQVTYENIGHLPHLEIPDRFHETIIGFLADK